MLNKVSIDRMLFEKSYKAIAYVFNYIPHISKSVEFQVRGHSSP